MTGLTRRQALKLMGLTPIAGLFACTGDDVERAALLVESLADEPYEPTFFTPDEYRTVHILADMVIPRDERSGSATDAGVPQFIDFMMSDGGEARRVRMREGLAWLDAEATSRHGAAFRECSEAERGAILDDIAWPDRAPEGLEAGVAFFNGFRDLTGAGFFSSRMGYADLDVRGNVYVAEWTGCPEPALRKLGVSYDQTGRGG